MASSNDIVQHVLTNVTVADGTGLSVYGTNQTAPCQTVVIKYKFTASPSFPSPILLLMITGSVGTYRGGRVEEVNFMIGCAEFFD